MNNITDYILVNTDADATEEKTIVPKKKTKVYYAILAKTNTDVVIQRKTSKTEQVMAMIPSKGQYYLSKDGETTALTPDGMNKFLSDMKDPLTVDLDWINEIVCGKDFAVAVLKYLDMFRDAICAGLKTVDEWERFLRDPYGRSMYKAASDLVQLYQVSPKLALFLKGMRDKTETREAINAAYRYKSFQPYACGAYEGTDKILWLYPFSLLFGLDKTRSFVEKMTERDLNFACPLYVFDDLLNEFYPRPKRTGTGTRYRNGERRDTVGGYEFSDLKDLAKIRNEEHLDADAFIRYCLTYQTEGFPELHSFFQNLGDDWRMQRSLYDHVREKYPKNLSTHHDRLSLARAYVAAELDEKAFKAQAEQNAVLEWSDENYSVIAPKSIGDMVDEATRQCNCLRSYIGRVINGDTSIFFLRRKKSPEDSLVTVEVRERRLVQVKGKFNKEPTLDQKVALSKWAEEMNLSYIY